jgi:hypothetical protein
MKITIEFNSVEEYLEFKEKSAQEEQNQEHFTICEVRNENGHSVIKQTVEQIMVGLHQKNHLHFL